MVIAFTVGAAFTALVKSLVDNVIMPPIAFLIGKVSFTDRFAILRQGSVAGPYATLQAANEAGAVTLSYGLFLNALVSFLVVALVVFFLVKGLSRLLAPKPAPAAAPTTKKCPYCCSEIALEATRCPHCTSQL
jgi:large conductance mechanosensitive channel